MVSLSFGSFMFFFIFLTIKDTIVHTDDQGMYFFPIFNTFFIIQFIVDLSYEVEQMVHEAENDNARTSHLSVEQVLKLIC